MRKIMLSGLGMLGLLGVFAACQNNSTNPTLQNCPATITTTADNKYSPSSCKITAGGSVTIQASASHPLRGVGAGNPVSSTASTTTTQTYTFTTPGTYDFECTIHGSMGMRGSITVVNP